MKALYDYLDGHTIGHVFTIHDVCPEAAHNKQVYYQITSAVARLVKTTKKSPYPVLRRVGQGKYCYNVAVGAPPKERKRNTDFSVKKDSTLSAERQARKAAKEDIHKDMESPEQPDTRSLQDSLSKLRVSKGVLDLLVNNKITFKVELVCSNVERNFQDEITRFSIESINVSVANVD